MADEYRQFSADLDRIHGALLQVKERFAEAVGVMREMETMNKCIQSMCKFRSVPFDTGDEGESIADIDLSDEAFAIKLSNIIRNKSGLERCAEMQALAVRIVNELSAFKSKKAKLDATIKLLPRETEEDKTAYGVQVAARTRVVAAIENRKGKLEYLVDRYLRQRRSNALRQIGIDELLYASLRGGGEKIHGDVFRANNIESVFKDIMTNDSTIVTERK